jgi:hypothetical protein
VMGIACHELEKSVEFPHQFQFSPYQHHHRSSLQLPTSTIAFALLAFRTLADFVFPEAIFAFRIRRSFAVAVGIFCAPFFLVCFFDLVVWLFVACMFLLKMQHQLLHACELVICL